jgi:diketogulonate reductase-like aldo/keto reductase
MAVAPIRRTVTLPSGEEIPALGMGTWHLGEDSALRRPQIAALQLGLDLGMSLIDTAEMYADGATEELVGEAIEGRRSEVFLVSKVLPSNAATRAGTIRACEASLRRLRTGHLDLYLLHWRSSASIAPAIAGFLALQEARKIRHWGVSNFDLDDMTHLVDHLGGGRQVQTDQVLYNLSHRGVEWDLLPWCERRNLPIMAYSPIQQGRLLGHPVLARIGERHGATPAQVALAWLLRREGVAAIPKAGSPAHVRENRDALLVHLTDQDLVALDRAFPPPRGPQPLAVL